MKKHLVFVYGSLKPFHGNHGVIEREELVADDALTVDEFFLLDLGSFPAMYKEKNVRLRNGVLRPDKNYLGRVKGYLYNVSSATLSRLDALEGEGDLYKREQIHVFDSGEEDTKQLAWCYFLLPQRSEVPENLEFIPNDNLNHLEW